MTFFTHAIISRLVSFNLSGPQECSLQSRFGLENYLKLKKMKLLMEIFFLYKFRKSFVYFAKKQRLWGKGKPCPIKLKFVLVVLMTLENGIRFLLTCFEKLFYFGQFWDTLRLEFTASSKHPRLSQNLSMEPPAGVKVQEPKGWDPKACLQW